MMNTRKKAWLDATWQSGAILFFAMVIGLSVNQLRPDKLLLGAERSAEAFLGLDAKDGLRISVETAERLFFAHGGVFLDTRSEESYALGHIKGAHSLPWEDFEKRFEEVFGDLDKNALIITYCDGKGCNLAEDVAFALLDRGHVNVFVLQDGWSVWQQRNLPIATGPACSRK